MDISPHNVLPDTEYALTELWKIPKEIKEDGPKTYSVTVKIEVKTPYGNVVSLQKSGEVEI